MEVSEHKNLNSSKGIIRDGAVKGESDDNIREYLQLQGVTTVKSFKVKKRSRTCLYQYAFAYIQLCGSNKGTQNFLSFQLPEVWSS